MKRDCVKERGRGAEALGLGSSTQPTNIVRSELAFSPNEANEEKRSNYSLEAAREDASTPELVREMPRDLSISCRCPEIKAVFLAPRLRHHVERHLLSLAHVVPSAPPRRD